MDLDERIDEVEPEPPPGLLGLEAGGQLVGDDVALEVVHDVERDADHALVLADGANHRQPDAVRRQGELEPRLAHHVVGRRRERRPRRPAQDEASVVPLEQKREVRAATLADAAGAHRPRAEPVLVEEGFDVLEDQQRRLVGQSTSSAIVAQRLEIAALDDERRHAALAPGVEPVGDLLARADERDLVDERVGHRRRRLELLAVEVEILDLRRLGLVAVAADEVVVEVLAARAHAADVEREVVLDVLAPALRILREDDVHAGGDVEPSFAPSSGKTSRKRSGETKIGSQPSAISAASATFFGPMAAR